jgi:hypothetical protein
MNMAGIAVRGHEIMEMPRRLNSSDASTATTLGSSTQWVSAVTMIFPLYKELKISSLPVCRILGYVPFLVDIRSASHAEALRRSS